MPPIKGHFDGTGIVLDESPPATLSVGQPVQVIVDTALPSPPRTSLVGFAQGTFVVRDDFDEPLDEFAEYR